MMHDTVSGRETKMFDERFFTGHANFHVKVPEFANLFS
jgi:hypothetical protein